VRLRSGGTDYTKHERQQVEKIGSSFFSQLLSGGGEAAPWRRHLWRDQVPEED